MPGNELYRVDLACAGLRPPPGLRQWREGVVVVVPLPNEEDGATRRASPSKRELWLRCKTVEEADEWRHALYDRQLVAQLAETASAAATEAPVVPLAVSPEHKGDNGEGKQEEEEEEAWEGWLPLVDCDGAALRLRFTSAEVLIG